MFRILLSSPHSLLPFLTPSLYLVVLHNPRRAFATKGKTKKAVSKRFKLMANNRIKRAHAGTGHNTGYRSTKRNNNLAKSTDIKQSKIDKTIRRMLQI